MNTAPAIEFPAPGAELTYQTPAPAALVVQSPEEYTATAEHLKTIKEFQRRVIEWFRPLKSKANEAHAALCREEAKLLSPSKTDETRIKLALTAYDTEQERVRREERVRLQQEQREREESERLAQAAALELQGTATGEAAYHEAAAQLLEQPLALAPVEPQTPAAPKVQGLSYRETWTYEVISDALIPREYLKRDDVKIAGVVRALKSSASIPGIRVVCEKTPVARTR